MKSQYVIPFVDAIRNLFGTMLQTEVAFDRPELSDGTEPGHDVSAIVGFTGRITGAVVLGFSQAVAEALVERFTANRFEMGHPDFADAVGELANMVAGGAKAALDTEGVSISCPSVIIGRHWVRQPRQRVLRIPCRSESGAFIAEVCLKAASELNPSECHQHVHVS